MVVATALMISLKEGNQSNQIDVILHKYFFKKARYKENLQENVVYMNMGENITGSHCKEVGKLHLYQVIKKKVMAGYYNMLCC